MTSDAHWLDVAARLALRGHGGAEPNPLVGCTLVHRGTLVGWGHHARCGGAHAEVAALSRAGTAARDSTAYVTLEPCAHVGRTGPCADALIRAGVRRVVIGSMDPNTEAAGGMRRLQDAGVDVDVLEHGASRAILAPFARRLATGLPWVTAKWAQTIDGRIATRTGASRWISGLRSRRMVHRERGRVDAIVTGIGTVLADDPMLTARGVRVRRLARRVVVDTHLRTPIDSGIAASADRYPTSIACAESVATSDHAARLREAGIEIIGSPVDPSGRLPLPDLLRALVTKYDTTHVLLEAGARLLGGFLEARLVQSAWVFVSPRLLADAEALPCAVGRAPEALDQAIALRFDSVHRRGEDLLLRAAVLP